MSREDSYLTADMHDMLKHTVLVRHQVEEHFHDVEHQTNTATFGMWLFLATEIMFFGAIFLALSIYRYQYADAFEKASEKLNWQIGGTNTLVLLFSSLTMVLAVHYARLGNKRLLILFLLLTAAIGTAFLVLKGVEYYSDYRDNLMPGWKFDPHEWTQKEGLSLAQVSQVKLFLMFYYIMTIIHAIHLTIAVIIVLILAALAAGNRFTSEYNAPVDIVGLYWHFVDVVWIFLLPMLYLLGTHKLGG
ncbi:MAG TPA: cytochrome c oxidase subunit 3 [Lacipirellulaceae bacterium]|nr:cytochrome c oxidase subunit 3 [Lacipirellulaceae bacterium]